MKKMQMLSLPWNQTTAIGYFSETCLGAMIGYALVTRSGCLQIFFISMCLHHRAFRQIFDHSLQKFNRSVKKKPESAKFLCKLIRLHILVKE